ncbi:hypothetical protein BGZ65_011742, partial [Modicella reniformis]
MATNGRRQVDDEDDEDDDEDDDRSGRLAWEDEHGSFAGIVSSLQQAEPSSDQVRILAEFATAATLVSRKPWRT